MGNASSSSKQVPLVFESSSPKKMQLLFTSLILASEPTSVSNDSFALSMLPRKILLQICELTSVETILTLMSTCKYIRNQLDTWFLQVLASENNPDRATSGFIADSIGDKGNTCLWRNAKFFIGGHDIPKGLSIHLFTNTTAGKISSDEVRSMIIQFSGSQESYYVDVPKFLRFLFLEVSFNSLKCLMLHGIGLSNELSQLIGKLNLDVFYVGKLCFNADPFRCEIFSRFFNPLKTLYIVHPDEDQRIFPPEKLERIVIYFPKSSKDMVGRREAIYTGLSIDMEKCHALKEM